MPISSPYASVARSFVAGTAVVAALCSSSALAAAQEGGLPVGTKAPSAAVLSMDGTPTDLSRFIGTTPTVIEFWATWCPLCKQLEPQFKASQQKYGRTVQFVSVGVPTNQTRDRQLAYITEHALGGTFVFDSAGNAMKAYKVPHTSHVLVVDRSGTIVYTGVGTAQVLDSAIARAMAKSGMN